jgi:GNAT superfamily N-acetyltransferase
MAFGSTFAREDAFPESVWHERAAGGASGTDRATFIAEEGVQWVGLVTGLAHDPENRGHAPMLVGMFVDRAKRGKGVGKELVKAVVAWARSQGATSLYLWVTATNSPAIALYERSGFARTVETQPLPHSPAHLEFLMVCDLRGSLQPELHTRPTTGARPAPRDPAGPGGPLAGPVPWARVNSDTLKNEIYIGHVVLDRSGG